MPAVAPCAAQDPGCSYTGHVQGLVPCVVIIGERGAVRRVELGGERLPAGVLCAVLGGGVSRVRSPWSSVCRAHVGAPPLWVSRSVAVRGLSPSLPGPCVESHTVGAVVSALGEPRMTRQSLSCSAESCPWLCRGLQNPVTSVPLTVCDTAAEPGPLLTGDHSHSVPSSDLWPPPPPPSPRPRTLSDLPPCPPPHHTHTPLPSDPFEHWLLGPLKTSPHTHAPAPPLGPTPASGADFPAESRPHGMAVDQECRQIFRGASVGRRGKRVMQKEDPSEKMKGLRFFL